MNFIKGIWMEGNLFQWATLASGIIVNVAVLSYFMGKTNGTMSTKTELRTTEEKLQTVIEEMKSEFRESVSDLKQECDSKYATKESVSQQLNHISEKQDQLKEDQRLTNSTLGKMSDLLHEIDKKVSVKNFEA